MKSYLVYYLSFVRKITLIIVFVFLTGVTSCNNSQNKESTDSNVGTAQDSLDIDTTANVGRGGTQESTGRADADTSGTGKFNTPAMPDSVR